MLGELPIEALIIFLGIVALFVIIIGGGNAFRRNFWLGLFILLVVPPLFIAWAVIEAIIALFTTKPNA